MQAKFCQVNECVRHALKTKNPEQNVQDEFDRVTTRIIAKNNNHSFTFNGINRKQLL